MQSKGSYIGKAFENVAGALTAELRSLRMEVDALREELSLLRRQIRQTPAAVAETAATDRPSASPAGDVPDTAAFSSGSRTGAGNTGPERPAVFTRGFYGGGHAAAQAWRTDIPGARVEDVREAFSLNDTAYFVRELFGSDREQFDLTVERINDTLSFEDVVSDMRAAFPEWDESSDEVYRFYMAVRRKYR